MPASRPQKWIGASIYGAETTNLRRARPFLPGSRVSWMDPSDAATVTQEPIASSWPAAEPAARSAGRHTPGSLSVLPMFFKSLSRLSREPRQHAPSRRSK